MSVVVTRETNPTKVQSVSVDGHVLPYPAIAAVTRAGRPGGDRWAYAARQQKLRGKGGDERIALMVRLGLLRKEGHTLYRTAFGAVVTMAPSVAADLRLVCESPEPVPAAFQPFRTAINRTTARSLESSGWIQQTNVGVKGLPRYEPTAAGRTVLAMYDDLWKRNADD